MQKQSIRRRTFTKLAGVAVVAGVAGCNDEAAPPEDDPDDDLDDGIDDDTEPEPDDEEEPVDDEEPDDEEPVDDEEPDDEEPDEMEDATVQVSEHEEYGEILVGPDGLSLYLFGQDEQDAGESACHDECAENWPPLTITEDEPVAGEGVTAELSTFQREDAEDTDDETPPGDEEENGENGEQNQDNNEETEDGEEAEDGEMQVAANGWPLYYFAEDQAEGDVNGQGVQNEWWLLSPDGEPVEDDMEDEETDDEMEEDEPEDDDMENGENGEN